MSSGRVGDEVTVTRTGAPRMVNRLLSTAVSLKPTIISGSPSRSTRASPVGIAPTGKSRDETNMRPSSSLNTRRLGSPSRRAPETDTGMSRPCSSTRSKSCADCNTPSYFCTHASATPIAGSPPIERVPIVGLDGLAGHGVADQKLHASVLEANDDPTHEREQQGTKRAGAELQVERAHQEHQHVPEQQQRELDDHEVEQPGVDRPRQPAEERHLARVPRREPGRGRVVAQADQPVKGRADLLLRSHPPHG